MKNDVLDLVSVQLLELQILVSYLCLKPTNSGQLLPHLYAKLALQRCLQFAHTPF